MSRVTSLILLSVCLGGVMSGCARAPRPARPVGEAIGEHIVRQGPFLRDEEEWTFIVAPYLWALSLDGDITIRGTTQAVDVSFGDLLENLSFGANVRVEAWKGK